MYKLIIPILFLASTAIAQPNKNITIADMRLYSYDFQIENGVFTGQGGAILKEAIADAHITMLGDENRSKLEYEFTEALMAELEKNAYKNMVLGIGAASAKVIDQLPKNEGQTVSAMKALNQKYALAKENSTYVPIPEFKSIAAAKYLQIAKAKDWSIAAIGADSWTGYKMLIDELYNNLSVENKQKNQADYQSIIRFLAEQYALVPSQNNANLLKFTEALRTCPDFDNFLDQMAVHPKNQPVIDEIRYSIEYWWLYGQRKFYKKNKEKAARNKQRLVQILKDQQFDFSKDKLFIKMWSNYLTKGTTVNGFYGIGNMLMEQADYHGNKTLNIAIARRYYKNQAGIQDLTELDNFSRIKFNELIPLGKKEEWVVVDLRPFNETFLWKGYELSAAMQKIISRYDLLVIPKVDGMATDNY